MDFGVIPIGDREAHTSGREISTASWDADVLVEPNVRAGISVVGLGWCAVMRSNSGDIQIVVDLFACGDQPHECC